jgi:aerobic-type carbon monoxide dehydrogenase small subunit (CoxS/CutS family)
MNHVTFSVNGRIHGVDVAADTPLLWVLRDDLNLTGTKFGCGIGLCGACTVHVGGVAKRSCQLPIASVAGAQITTIEGLVSVIGRSLQEAWLAEDVAQCGYCQAGQLMSAAGLLAVKPTPSDSDIDAAMAGNICRCGTYQRIRRAIHRAVSR